MHCGGAARYSASTRKRALGFAQARGTEETTPRTLEDFFRHPTRCLHKAPATPAPFYLLRRSRWDNRPDGIVAGVDGLVAGRFRGRDRGRGGLILVPALFAIFPGTHPATLFGVNKSASIWGTAMAALQYSRRVQLSWSALLPAAAAGFAGSLRGRLGGDRGVARFPAQAPSLDPARSAGLHPGQERSGPAPRAPAVGAARSRGGRRHRAGAGLLRRLLRSRHGQLLRLPVRALARL